MTRKERIIVVLLAGLNFTHILDFMIMMPLGNYLMPYFDITPRQFSFFVSAYSISAAVSGFIAAFYVDHFDRKKILVVCYVGFLLGTIACGFADTYNLLFISRILAGIFGGIIGAQVFSIIADIFPYERRGVAMGSVMSAFAVASILGVPFSLYLTNMFQDDWHIPFLLVGGVGILLVPLIIKYIPAMDGHIQDTEKRKSLGYFNESIANTSATFCPYIFRLVDDGSFFDYSIYQSLPGIQ